MCLENDGFNGITRRSADYYSIPIPVLPMETVIIILTLYYFTNYYFLASFRYLLY